MRVRGKNQAAERAALAFSAVLALGNVASAEPESVRIDYVAPAGCPDATAFMRSLRRRTTRFQEATSDAQARKFLVRVKAAASTYSGRLEIRNPDGRTAMRSLDGAFCDEVASALALITALAIDPNALTDGSNEAGTSQAEPSPGAADRPARGRSPTSEVAVATSSPAAAPPASRPWRWSAGLLGHTTFLVSPTLGYGGDLFVEAEAPASSRPAARLGIFLNQADVELSTGAAARFRWALVGVEGCPFRLGGTSVGIHPCLGFRLGIIHGEGRRISQPRRSVSLWSDVGAVLRLRLALTARLLLEAQGSVVFPLHRPTFDIVDMGSSTTAYSVPRVGGAAAIGVAYQFR